jgi:serine protease AprX
MGTRTETRGNSLTGSGGRDGASRSRRLLGVLAVALLALTIMPAAAVAKDRDSDREKGDGHGKKSEAAPGSLLAAIEASPDKRFRVIIQLENGVLTKALAKWVEKQENRGARTFQRLNALSIELRGNVLEQLIRHENKYGELVITRDAVVGSSDLPGGPMWQKSVKADKLWSRAPITCLLDTVTGLQLDPTCVSEPGYVAPQAPGIAIVDSGVDQTRIADFGGRVVAAVNLSTLPTQFPTGDPMGHGTLVAGIAAGAAETAPGVSPNAPIIDVRTSDENGQSLTSDVLAGIDWILANKAAHNIKVANFSMAATEETSFKFDPLTKAVQRLWLNGITVVASAGNHGSATGPVKFGAPGNSPFVITVGAVDQSGTENPSDDFHAPWSAYGFTADGFGKPELSAPGRYMVGPVPAGSSMLAQAPDRLVSPGYMWMSGTSFSAPVVSGVAAQLLALRPSWGPDQVKGALMLTARATADGNAAGVGEIDALAASQVASPPNPNENLYQFVTANADGQQEFDPLAWQAHVSTNASWATASWATASWATASWATASWATASWATASWATASWATASWATASWATNTFAS